jgi:hypothetical protein
MADKQNSDKLDKVLAALDVMAQRMDAIERAGADARKRARADAEKGKNYVPPLAGDRDDPARKIDGPRQTAADNNTGTTSMTDDDLPTQIQQAKKLRDELYERERRISAAMKVQGPLCQAEEEQIADAQSRCDAAYSAFGKRAPAPLPGERLAQYLPRILKPLQRHSETWRDVKIENFSGKNLEKIERDIIADAQVFADSAENVPSGDELVAVQKRDDSGRMITTFRGRRSFINQFRPPAHVATITDPKAIELRALLQRSR